MGLVGVASWGPVNAIGYVSKVTDAATVYGQPTNRPRDIMSYIEAATQTGGAIGFGCVRVTDGTDAAASVTVQSTCLTLTAISTGIMGNQVQFSVQSGSQAGSYMGIVSFPGLPPEQYNNIGLGIGSISTTAGTSYTSVPSASVTAAPAGGVNAVVQPTLSVYGTPTVATGGTSGFAVNDLIYCANGVVLKVAAVATGVVSTVTLQSGGLITGGSTPSNPISMTSTSGAGVGTPTFNVTWGLGTPNVINPGSGYLTAPSITLSGGGTGSGGSYTASLSVWLNMANAINNGNATRGPSKFVTATAGTGTTTPTLSSPVTLSGGTDGANGVTDATLVGADTLPRKGMYVLRGSLVTDFALCDHSTSSQYAAISSFGLAELMTPVFATVSGDVPATAVTTVANSGNDTPWGWCILGDFPTFYDAANGLSRQISPAAFGIGILGNLSPQQSPLNKPLQGVTATQRSTQGYPYSDAELTIVNTGRIDVIVPPANSSGGDYFSFGSGRNMSSNTAASGIEYTRMTNFLMRAAKTKAAGSIRSVNSRASSRTIKPARMRKLCSTGSRRSSPVRKRDLASTGRA